MSASPPAAAATPVAPTQSTKRPLEDPSSPSTPDDQPDAKRPALDKVVKNDAAVAETTEETPAHAKAADAANGVKPEAQDAQGDTTVADAPTQATQSIESMTSTAKAGGSAATQHDETTWIHLRAIITSAEAATVIGKGGENVSMTRKMSGAKCTVSDYQKGAVERILTVSGVVDAVAKVSLRPATLTKLML